MAFILCSAVFIFGYVVGYLHSTYNAEWLYEQDELLEQAECSDADKISTRVEKGGE